MPVSFFVVSRDFEDGERLPSFVFSILVNSCLILLSDPPDIFSPFHRIENISLKSNDTTDHCQVYLMKESFWKGKSGHFERKSGHFWAIKEPPDFRLAVSRCSIL